MVIYGKIPYLSITYKNKNMRIKTTQEQTFADSFINTPNSQLDIINKLINWHIVAKKLTNIKSDYSVVSLFKALLIGTWHNLSDEKLADSLGRDLVFMNFCEFSISGNKPDATTHPANDSDMTTK